MNIKKKIFFYYHVWLFGKSSLISWEITFFILKGWILSFPWRSLKPVTGICELPVANKSKFLRFSSLYSRTHYFILFKNIYLFFNLINILIFLIVYYFYYVIEII